MPISIHALREEGDPARHYPTSGPANFYPRPPRGGRRLDNRVSHRPLVISIHALREEGDLPGKAARSTDNHFYPRPPRGGRPRQPARSPSSCNFYPRPPRGGRRHRGPDRPHDAANFYPRPPRGGRLHHVRGAVLALEISIHALREEGDPRPSGATTPSIHFYPRPPRGGRQMAELTKALCKVFLSTPSARRATQWLQHLLARHLYFYPRPPRGGRPRLTLPWFRGYNISIHALREEGDLQPHRTEVRLTDFYPRPPRGGRPAGVGAAPNGGEISIHALREEGDPLHRGGHGLPAISIHALREEGDLEALRVILGVEISIHALREEGDSASSASIGSMSDFYPRPPRGGRPAASTHHSAKPSFLSTPSARRATLLDQTGLELGVISIHALREEGDRQAGRLRRGAHDFYPRPPRGGRQWRLSQRRARHDFYPRPPRGGRRKLATIVAGDGSISIHALREEGDRRDTTQPAARPISIHALREEGDALCDLTVARAQYFYPRPPRGGRPEQQLVAVDDVISIHALREEGDPAHRGRARRCLYFYPRPPRGGRRRLPRGKHPGDPISIHALREEGDGLRDQNEFVVHIDISIHALREEGDLMQIGTS